MDYKEIILFQVHENANACVDSCEAAFDSQFKIDLKTGKYDLKDNYLVQLVEHELDSPSEDCAKNGKIPFFFYNLI
jgi:hypothetical protein